MQGADIPGPLCPASAPMPMRYAPPMTNEMNRGVIEQFRATGGNIVEGRFAGSKLLLLTTKGAKTGATRVNPMMYYQDGDAYVVFASHRSAPTNPDWYHNLVAHPEVNVEAGGDSFTATAKVAQGEERQRIWDDAARQFPFLTEHQAATRRQIPVVVLAKR